MNWLSVKSENEVHDMINAEMDRIRKKKMANANPLDYLIECGYSC